MYTAAYTRNKDSPNTVKAPERLGKTKVDSVCDAVRQALIDIDENRLVAFDA